MKTRKSVAHIKSGAEASNPVDAPCIPSTFVRVYPDAASYILSQYANQSTKVLLYLLQHMDDCNRICCSYAEIQDACMLSNRTVISRMMRKLVELHAIVIIRQGLYMVNPTIMVKGNQERFTLLFQEFQRLLVGA